MTGSTINLPITSPAAGGAGVGAPAPGKAAGFDALLAAFFGAPGDALAAGGPFGENKVAKEEGSVADPAVADATQLLNPDAMTLAAMLATPQPPAQTQPSPSAEATTPSNSPPTPPATPFAPVMPAPAIGGADPAATLAAAAEGELTTTAEDAAVLATAQVPDQGASKPVGEKPPPSLNVNSAPRAPAVPLPQVQPTPAPVQQAVVEPIAQAEVTPTEIPLAEESIKDKPATGGKSADPARKNSQHVATAATAAVADPETPTAVVAAADAASLGDNGSTTFQDDIAVPVTREAKPEPAKASATDAQAPGPAAPAHASAQAQAHASIHSAVRGSPETVANLAAQIIQKLDGRSTRFDVELNPLGLGQVNVAVEIAANGKMTAALSFETQHAANELRGRSADLQRALEQAGFDVSGGLSFDVAGDGRSAWTDQQQQQQQQTNGAWRGRAFQAVLGTAGDAAESAVSDALNYQRRTRSGVDVRI
ncbi:flagellar hook-length control protein FliK [Phenylobacterium sp. LH3H17]|uniref:flagellar hook-length control protein FliK n=1 Tax=Phenylobacterium sp. LH3H17 TaxID=2903901 RepID=UPI0020CA1DFB|nr:flagellar hook-length control protein FliK [Phenylobacterium sp. LH3H17]UTP38565.1 flagellar hook-length control protein FliK [Phenylobacterium sp. LH3H17]